MVKKIKMIWWIILIILILSGIIVWFFNQESEHIIPKVEISSRLDDPDLLYASLYSAGLCRNEKGEQGGCYTEYYLYTTGKFIKIVGWQGINGEKDESPDENFLSSTIVDQVAQQLRDSDIMTKDCPPQEIMDAAWDYQVNLDGTKILFHNPPEICEATFNDIDKILDSIMNDSEEAALMERKEITIITGTVARLGNIDIGVINTSNDSAFLSIHKKDGQVVQKNIKIGEKIEVFGSILEALDTQDDKSFFNLPGSNNGYVELRITTQKIP